MYYFSSALVILLLNHRIKLISLFLLSIILILTRSATACGITIIIFTISAIINFRHLRLSLVSLLTTLVVMAGMFYLSNVQYIKEIIQIVS